MTKLTEIVMEMYVCKVFDEMTKKTSACKMFVKLPMCITYNNQPKHWSYKQPNQNILTCLLSFCSCFTLKSIFTLSNSCSALQKISNQSIKNLPL